MDLWSPLNCQVQTSDNGISWMWCICVYMELNASFTGKDISSLYIIHILRKNNNNHNNTIPSHRIKTNNTHSFTPLIQELSIHPSININNKNNHNINPDLISSHLIKSTPTQPADPQNSQPHRMNPHSIPTEFTQEQYQTPIFPFLFFSFLSATNFPLRLTP